MPHERLFGFGQAGYADHQIRIYASENNEACTTMSLESRVAPPTPSNAPTIGIQGPWLIELAEWGVGCSESLGRPVTWIPPTLID